MRELWRFTILSMIYIIFGNEILRRSILPSTGLIDTIHLFFVSIYCIFSIFAFDLKILNLFRNYFLYFS